MKYNPSSSSAAEFINHDEIMATLSWVDENKNNLPLLREILSKAALHKGLNHREAALLLEAGIQGTVLGGVSGGGADGNSTITSGGVLGGVSVGGADGNSTITSGGVSGGSSVQNTNGVSGGGAISASEGDSDESLGGIREEIFALARSIKNKYYGNRVVLFAPLYLSNYCVNGCVYCPYNCRNKSITRKKLTQDEIRREVIALQDMGHKRIVLEAGEHPVHSPIEYILESIKTIYSTRHKNGAIRRLNVNLAATSVSEYQQLKQAGIGTYTLFQETYHRENYQNLHPFGPKSDYDWHTEAMDRAMQGGLDDVGIGVLFGLAYYRYEFVGLLMHAEHLEQTYGIAPHTISVPRIQGADSIDLASFNNQINDDIFAQIVACLRISAPFCGIILSTRESKQSRERALSLGVSQISGGSLTSVGGYENAATESSGAAKSELLKSSKSTPENSKQFEISDHRTLGEIVRWLMEIGHLPSFCTACYREGRTGDRFFQQCKSGKIHDLCQSNALMTLQEYLLDYADEDTSIIGGQLIDKELPRIPNERVRRFVAENLEKIKGGQRDFRL